MPIGFIIGLGSGLASALLFYSAARGSPLLSTVLLLLTPLPMLLAGLGWGWLPATAGAVVGTLVMGFAASPTFGVGYGLALGLPTIITSYLAYLSRPGASDPNVREWYPAGRLLAAMSLYAGALPLLILPLIGGSYDLLRDPLAEFYRRLSVRAAPELGMAPLNDAQIAALSDLTVAVLPGALAGYWFVIFALNAYIAGRVALASGRLGRDWPDLAALSYPPGFPLLAALALVGSFMPGLIGVAGASFSGGLLLAYLFAGLALMHFIARGRAPWLLWLLYALLLVFGPYVAFALILAGLLDPMLNLKHRFGAPPPAT